MSFLSAGHQITIKAGGIEIGGARSININQDWQLEPGYIVGSIMPVEINPMRWNGSLELEKFYLRSDIGSTTNIDLSSEGALTISGIDIEILDKELNQTILVAQGCIIQSANINVTANAYTGERGTFIPMRIVRSSIGTPVISTGL